MKNLIDGGYQGHLYPVHPRAEEILGKKCYASVLDIPTEVDIAIFCIPARFVASVIAECGEKNIAGAVLIPSGFAEIGEHELQNEVVEAARKHNVRLMGPNIYGFYYTHHDLCATFLHALYRTRSCSALFAERRSGHGHHWIQPQCENGRVSDCGSRQQSGHRRRRSADILRGRSQYASCRDACGGP